MKTLYIFFPFLFLTNIISAQTPMIPQANPNDYFFQIPDYPENYSAETVSARLIDGLGFRFYWATEGLTQKDLDYKPSEESRTCSETMDHIIGMSYNIVNAVKNIPNERIDRSGMTPSEKRQKALNNLKEARELLLAANPGEIENMNVIFGSNTFPFWNMINGPISDCIYHTGQIVTFRRSSGNPIDPNISLLRGKKRE